MSAFHDNALMGASGSQGYTIARSVRLRSSASAYFNRTFGTPTNNKIWSYSLWVKRGKLGAEQELLNANSVNSQFYFSSSDTLNFYDATAGATYYSTQVFRDPSAWYHIVVSVDTTQATSGNRVRIYVNGSQITAFSTGTAPTQNNASAFNIASTVHTIGRYNPTTTNYLDGYLTEVNFIDGQALTPSSFGETDSITGVWKAKKYGSTYGTNGFYLNFSDNSAATASTIGKDYSGNGNNWTPNNISVSSGVTYDSMVDSPTVSAVSSNYCVLNPLTIRGATGTLTNGNLSVAASSSSSPADTSMYATMGLPSNGLIYLEALYTVTAGIGNDTRIGVSTVGDTGAYVQAGSTTGYWSYDYKNGTANAQGSNTSYTAATTGQTVMWAIDVANGKIWAGANGTWFNSGNPAAGTGAVLTGVSTSATNLQTTLNGWVNRCSLDFNFGQRPFSYTPPTGFVALNTNNLPAGTITTSGSFTGNTSTDGPFVYLNGVPTAMTINGNAVTFGTHADHTANGFKVRSASSSYNASGSNTYSISTTGSKFKYANAQTNP